MQNILFVCVVKLFDTNSHLHACLSGVDTGEQRRLGRRRACSRYSQIHLDSGFDCRGSDYCHRDSECRLCSENTEGSSSQEIKQGKETFMLCLQNRVTCAYTCDCQDSPSPFCCVTVFIRHTHQITSIRKGTHCDYRRH